MINVIPLFGWIISFLVSASMAIPFWFLWRICGIGDTYFYFVPEIYRGIGFWSCVGLFMVISILKAVIFPHNLVSASSTSK